MSETPTIVPECDTPHLPHDLVTVRVGARFWNDHVDRACVQHPDQVTVDWTPARTIAVITAPACDLWELLNDAEHYAADDGLREFDPGLCSAAAGVARALGRAGFRAADRPPAPIPPPLATVPLRGATVVTLADYHYREAVGRDARFQMIYEDRVLPAGTVAQVHGTTDRGTGTEAELWARPDGKHVVLREQRCGIDFALGGAT